MTDSMGREEPLEFRGLPARPARQAHRDSMVWKELRGLPERRAHKEQPARQGRKVQREPRALQAHRASMDSMDLRERPARQGPRVRPVQRAHRALKALPGPLELEQPVLPVLWVPLEAPVPRALMVWRVIRETRVSRARQDLRERKVQLVLLEALVLPALPARRALTD